MSAITSCKCRTPPSLPQCFIAPSIILSKGVVFSIAQSFSRYEALQTDLNTPCTPIVSLLSILSLGLFATLLQNFALLYCYRLLDVSFHQLASPLLSDLEYLHTHSST